MCRNEWRAISMVSICSIHQSGAPHSHRYTQQTPGIQIDTDTHNSHQGSLQIDADTYSRHHTEKRVDEVVRYPHLVTQDQFTQVLKKVSDIPEENFTKNIELFQHLQSWKVSKAALSGRQPPPSWTTICHSTTATLSYQYLSQ